MRDLADVDPLECPTCGVAALRGPADTLPPSGPTLPLDVLVYAEEHPLVVELLLALIRADYSDRDLGVLLALVRRSEQDAQGPPSGGGVRCVTLPSARSPRC